MGRASSHFPRPPNSLSGLSAYSGKLGSRAARTKASDSAGSFSSWLLNANEAPPGMHTEPKCRASRHVVLRNINALKDQVR